MYETTSTHVFSSVKSKKKNERVEEKCFPHASAQPTDTDRAHAIPLYNGPNIPCNGAVPGDSRPTAPVVPCTGLASLRLP